MATLLFEIGTEELPSWYVSQGRSGLARLAAERLTAAGIAFGSVRSFGTPRRLAVLVENLAERSAVREELKRGPATSAAFGEGGTPTRAAEGFAKANGVDPAELFVQETDKGAYVFVRKTLGGESASELLPALLGALVRDLPAPRKMRWGEVEIPFLRPVAWLVALLDDTVIPVSAAGVMSGRMTRGHRFLGREGLELPHASDYETVLERASVIADQDERRAVTLRAAQEAAASESLTLLNEPGLLGEVADLLEAPFAILGHFDERYLSLPEEVLVTTMIHHQRFFPTRRGDGTLAPYFVGVSNNDVPDRALVQRGYEGALNPRLSDAQFFWDADRSRSLSQHAWALSGVGFHKGLGTMADKVARTHTAALALTDLLGLNDAEKETLGRALPVYKADLATQMVDELPELEGVIGRAYALAEGQSAEVAEALESGVRPVTAGGSLPGSKVGAVLALADRLDKLIGFFALGQRPSGSADPFGLRRDAVAVSRILNAQGWRVGLGDFVRAAATAYTDGNPAVTKETVTGVVTFIWDRVTGLLELEGVPGALVRAVTADTPPVITASRRAHLLKALSLESEFESLLQLYKRAANLAKQLEGETEINPKRFSSPFEQPLYEAIPGAKGALEELLGAVRQELAPWDLGSGPSGELKTLPGLPDILALKAPLDAFLDNVLVMVGENAVRRNRLALLDEVSGSLRELGQLEVLEGLSS